MMAETLIVTQQPRRTSRLGDQDVDVAVAVDVRVGRAAPDDRRSQVSRLRRRHLHEDTAIARSAGVPQQLNRLAVSLERTDILDLFLELTVGVEKIQSPVKIG